MTTLKKHLAGAAAVVAAVAASVLLTPTAPVKDAPPDLTPLAQVEEPVIYPYTNLVVLTCDVQPEDVVSNRLVWGTNGFTFSKWFKAACWFTVPLVVHDAAEAGRVWTFQATAQNSLGLISAGSNLAHYPPPAPEWLGIRFNWPDSQTVQLQISHALPSSSSDWTLLTNWTGSSVFVPVEQLSGRAGFVRLRSSAAGLRLGWTVVYTNRP